MEETQPELLTFFKALADETRLRMAGLLARESYTGEQLAAQLGLSPATISHHLARLSEAGLVTSETSGHARFYRLRLDAVHQLAARLADKDALSQAAQETIPDDYDRSVMRNYARADGTLKEIPAQQKKLQAVLRHLAREFEEGRKYTEKQVNTILGRFHPDTASLRRALIEYKLLERGNNQYWRAADRPA